MVGEYLFRCWIGSLRHLLTQAETFGQVVDTALLSLRLSEVGIRYLNYQLYSIETVKEVCTILFEKALSLGPPRI